MSGYGSFRFALVALIPMSFTAVGCVDDPAPETSGGEGGGGEGGGGEGGATTSTVGGGGEGGATTSTVGGGGEGGDICATLDCDDENPCTADSCDPTDGCQNTAVADDTPCVDGDVCNGDESCQAGTCEAGLALDCDDENSCTADNCDATLGCQTTILDGSPCDDGVVCTDNDLCQLDASCAGTANDELCNDNDRCTSDACDAVLDCQFTDVSAACDDGDQCNGTETCDPGLGCVSPNPVGYLEDFNASAPGWTLGTLPGPLVDINSWSLVSMSGNVEPTAFSTQVYGNPNHGDLGEEHSYLQSPSIDLTGGGTVQFQTWSGNEGPGYDLERLDVSYNGGTDFQVLIDDLDPKWCSQYNWVPMDVTIDAADGTSDTVFRFVFDSVDECCGDDGWYVDNFMVRPNGAVDCDDADPCTVDICVNNACQNPGEAGCELGPFFDCAGSGE